jgi:hypothetical protein
LSSTQSEEIHFAAATVYARKIVENPKKLVSYGTHRLRMAKLDTGYLIVERRWFPK